MATPCFVLAAMLLLQTPQEPQQPQQPSGPPPGEILQKVLATYAAAKTYQSTWTYTLTRGSVTQEMEIEIRAKAPDRILFRVSLPKGKKPPTDRPVPELLVVLDGRNAWYQNTTEKTFFKVPLPKEPKYTPLMFFPQLATAGPVRRMPDVQVGDRTLIALEADRKEGGTVRMELDGNTYRVHRITDTSVTAFITTVSTITVKQETFDGPVDEKGFTYKPPRGFKEIPAPPGAGAIFGP